MEHKTKSIRIVKLINSLMQEFEAAQTKPNILLITETLLNDIQYFFPYLIKDSIFTYNSVKLNVVITKSNIIGLAFSFYFDLPSLEESVNESA